MNSVKRMVAALAVAGLGGVLANSAHAQTPTNRVQKPFRIQLGAYFPTDSNVKDAVGSTMFQYGLSYDFAKTQATNPVTFNAYIDGALRTGDETIGGQNFDTEFTLTGFGVGLRSYFTPATAGTRLYGGAGIGAYSARVKASRTENNVTVSASESSTKFGGKLLVGGEINQGFLAELSYTFVDKVSLGGENYNPSGVGLTIGYRF